MQQLLESLSFPQKSYRFTTIESAYRETCQWLFETPEYTRWRDWALRGVHSRTLWLKGKPGTGKSTITKCALEHANTMYLDERNIYFFFNARGDKLEKCTEGMFRSLLHQVAQDVPSLLQLVHTDAVEDYTRTGWPLDLLRSLFREAVLSLASNVQLNCYIDALDEGEDEDQTREMVRCFEDLAETAVWKNLRFSVFFASRHYPNITTRRSESIILDDYEGHRADIASYVWNTLWCQPSTLKAELAPDIIQRSSGIFLWVVLVVRNLNTESARGNQHNLKTSLQATPKGLDDLFGSMVGDGDPEGILLPTLLWALFTKRPLSPLDLYLAVMHSKTPDKPSSVVWDHATVDTTSINNFITSSSRGFLQVVTPTNNAADGPSYARSQDHKHTIVQFIHESVRRYMLETGLVRLDPALTENVVGISNLRLAQWCLSYAELSLQHSDNFRFAKFNSLLLSYLEEVAPFSHHALAEILNYSEEAASCGLLVLIPFEDCFQTGLSLFITLTTATGSTIVGRQTILHVLAREGHTSLIRNLLKRYSPTVRQDYINLRIQDGGEDQSVALHLAAQHRRLDVVQILLQNGADVNARDANDRTALLYAARSGLTEMTLTALSFGADANATDDRDRSALHYCIEVGDFRACEELVRCGADVNTCDVFGLTPLMVAVIVSHSEIVKTLLAHSSDVNATDEDGLTPLYHAYLSSTASGMAIPTMLLQHGANPDVRGHDVEPLLVTVVLDSARGAEHVELLLRYGADVNASDNDCQTTLHVAARLGNVEIIEKLLQHNADVNARDKLEITPLILTLLQGEIARAEVVEILLQNGASVDAVGWLNTTALYAAVLYANVEVTKMLLVYGADVYGQREGKQSIMDIAHENSNEDISRLLTYFADVQPRARFEAARALEDEEWWKEYVSRKTR